MVDVGADLRACLIDWNDTAKVRGREVPGFYFQRQMDEGSGDDAVSAFFHGFGCMAADVPDVARGDILEVVGRGKFRLLRQFTPDESGLVHLELGVLL